VNPRRRRVSARKMVLMSRVAAETRRSGSQAATLVRYTATLVSNARPHKCRQRFCRKLLMGGGPYHLPLLWGALRRGHPKRAPKTHTARSKEGRREEHARWRGREARVFIGGAVHPNFPLAKALPRNSKNLCDSRAGTLAGNFREAFPALPGLV